MKMSYKIIAIIFSILLFNSCLRKENNIVDPNKKLNEIIKRKRLIAVTDYNVVSYFIFQGQPMGFQYDMLNAFAKYLGVTLEIIPVNNITKAYQYLKDGKCDLIASELIVTKSREKEIDFCNPYTKQRQVLIQRIPSKESKTAYLSSYLELAKKSVAVQGSSSFYERIIAIQNEIGDTIYVKEDEENEEEQLIEMVAKSEIDYTIATEHFAKVSRRFYNNIDISVPVSLEQNIAWGISKNSGKFLDTLNVWMNDYIKSPAYRLAYTKYYSYINSQNIIENDKYSVKGKKISSFDKYLKKYSKLICWDWRLLASLIYQESKFNPTIIGSYGTFGLMQFTTSSGHLFGVSSSSSPEEQIYGGVKLLQVIDKKLPIEIDSAQERVKFVIASYNAGLGHILDARRLAKKYGKNENIWTDNVETYVLYKSKSKYYNDPVVKLGFLKGIITYKFVREIIERYSYYKNSVPY